MKKTKIFAAVAASAVAAAALTAVASAYDLGDKNLGTGWSLKATVPAEEFANITADSYITITFTADPDEQEYWCIKPCSPDWTFIAINEYLAEGEEVISDMTVSLDAGTGKNDAFGIPSADITSITFKVPSGAVDSLKENGMFIPGHSLVLHELTISDKAPDGFKPAAPADDNNGGAGDTDGGDDDGDKGTPNTGIEGVAVAAAVALTAAAAVVISRKRK